MPKTFYRPELDALRFFAFLCVLSSHVHFFSTPFITNLMEVGSFGMCLFFLLSAYLIVSLLLQEKNATQSIDLKAFAIRRILRIWPLYYAVLFAYAYFGPKLGIGGMPGHSLLAFSFLAGNFYIGAFGWVTGPGSTMWSLSVEEQFYVLVPSFVRISNKRVMIISSGVIIVIAYVTLLVLGTWQRVPMVAMWTNSLIQFQFFAAGAIIAILKMDKTVRMKPPVRLGIFGSGIMLWYFAIAVCHICSFLPIPTTHLLLGYFAVLIGTSAIIVSVLDMSFAWPKPILYCGKISYGLYMFHNICLGVVRQGELKYFPANGGHGIKVAGVAFAVVLTFVMAILSYEYFEKPILQYKRKFERIHTRTA